LPSEQIIEYYQPRFQIEFIFRDPKQFTGLSGQARHLPRLDFHFNASLIALNLAKYQLSSCHSSAKSFVFSMTPYKRLEFNKHLLCTFIRPLAKINWTGSSAHPTKKITLVGWAEEPVPSIEEKNFCKRSNDKLDLDADLILNHPNLPSVLSYGTLVA
jgi:hypothetical protein